MKSHIDLAPISLDGSAAEASSTEENLFKLQRYPGFMVLLETMKETKTKRFPSSGEAVVLYLPGANHLSLCERE